MPEYTILEAGIRRASQWKAIEIGEVHRRIRGALGDRSDGLLESLSVAVMMSIPPPSAIVKY